MSKNSLANPCHNQVKLRKPYSSHEFVVPFNNFAPLPSKSRMIQQIHQKRTSIKNQEEDDNKPLKPAAVTDEDDEDTPLALLAYKKGILVPDEIETMYPLIQHIPKADTTQRNNRHYYHYPSLVLTHSEPNMKSLFKLDENTTRRQSSYF